MKTEFIKERYQVKRNFRYGKNMELLESFMKSDCNTLKLVLKIGKDKDRDYTTLAIARTTFFNCAKRIGLKDSLYIHQQQPNILYIVKKDRSEDSD